MDMDNVILPSTLVLTLLLSVGLFFFIRAATKDRTTVAKLLSDEEEGVLMPKVKEYFRSRSYQVAQLDRDKNQVIFEGFVQPSLWLAVFLTLLASVGMTCLSLVLSLLFPDIDIWFLGLVLLSPLAGVFYWQKAGRVERVSFQMELSGSKNLTSTSAITVVAHRDELAELQQSLQLKSAD